MSSIEALWVVRFGAPGTAERDLDGGCLVFETGRILGGDSGYAYLGHYDLANGEISGTLTIIRHNLHVESIYGPETRFDLKFDGKRVGDDTIQGRLIKPGFPDAVLILRRLAPLP